MADRMKNTSVNLVRKTLVKELNRMGVGKGFEGNDIEAYDGTKTDQLPYDYIQVADVEDWVVVISKANAANSRKKRDESYVVVLSMFAVRDDFEEANDAVFEIYTVLEDLLAESVSLGLDIPTLVVGISQENDLNMTYDEGSGGLGGVRSHITCRIQVTSQLR